MANTEAAEPELDPAEALRRQVAVLKEFLAEHPEVAAELGAPAPSGPPVPLTFYHVVHALIDQVGGIDHERHEQMHAAVDEHEAAHTADPAAREAAARQAREADAEAQRKAEAEAEAAAAAEAERQEFLAWKASQKAPEDPYAPPVE